MTQLRFRDLPLVVRVSSALSMLSGWVLFEEFGIDRYHLDVYLPLYRVGRFCTYDATAIALIIVFWIAAHRNTVGTPSRA